MPVSGVSPESTARRWALLPENVSYHATNPQASADEGVPRGRGLLQRGYACEEVLDPSRSGRRSSAERSNCCTQCWRRTITL
jgi:hypothetical protein